jgi:glutathione S-transferase
MPVSLKGVLFSTRGPSVSPGGNCWRAWLGPPESESLKPKIPNLLRFAKVLDGHLAGRRHVACGRLTIADFQLASMATYWRESEMPLAAFPNVVHWLDGLMRIPAWADPWPADTQAAA